MAAGPVPPLDAAALDGLRALFDAFDDDRDGLLEPAELGAILAAAGVTLSESEVLDLVTEVKPTLRKLPFDEFVAVMCRPFGSAAAVRDEVRDCFATFAVDGQITVASLQQAMAALGHPVSKAMVRARPRPRAPHASRTPRPRATTSGRLRPPCTRGAERGYDPRGRPERRRRRGCG